MNKEEFKKKIKSKKCAKQSKERDDLKIEKDNVKNSAGVTNHSRYGNPNWYFTDHELAEQASRFSFQNFIGNGELVDGAQLPSICALYCNPAIGGYVGVTQDYDPLEQSAAMQSVNLMARKIYSRLANKSGRTQSYAPQDVVTVLLALGEIVSLVSHMRRILGLSYVYNWRNRDFPKHIIQAMGVNVEDLFANLSVYRTKFNTTIQIANKIPFPKNIMWFEKCNALYDGVFMDSPDAMASVYFFAPATTWVLDETAYEGGTILKTTPVCCNVDSYNPVVGSQTFGDLLTLLNVMIDTLLTSSTYNVIYGDILNLASQQNVELMVLPLVPEDYAVTPTYDPEILLHIHNADIFRPLPYDNTPNTLVDLLGRSISNGNDVFPDPNTNNLIYAPQFRIEGSKAITENVLAKVSHMVESIDIVDYPYGNPDLTERIEGTRFSIRLNPNEVVEGKTDEDSKAYAQALPDHYITRACMFVGGVTNNAALSVLTTLNSTSDGSNNARQVYLNKFRYSPVSYRYTPSTGLISNVDGEINYFTHLDGEWIKRLNDLCYQGLFELR